jgi:hypothetical protein
MITLLLTRIVFLAIPLILLFLVAYTMVGAAALQWPVWGMLAGGSIVLFGLPRPARGS